MTDTPRVPLRILSLGAVSTEDLKQSAWKVGRGEATVDEILRYVADELREALDCGDPPAEGRGRDSFHASCCVLRAWAVLTGTRFQQLRAEAEATLAALQAEHDALKQQLEAAKVVGSILFFEKETLEVSLTALRQAAQALVDRFGHTDGNWQRTLYVNQWFRDELAALKARLEEKP